MTVAFQLDSQNFLALNGGPDFTFSLAIPFIANCRSLIELDERKEKPPCNSIYGVILLKRLAPSFSIQVLVDIDSISIECFAAQYSLFLFSPTGQ